MQETEDAGSILGSGRSSGARPSNPLQYSCLENPRDRGAGQAAVQWSQRVGQDYSDSARMHDALKEFLRHHYIKGKQSCLLFQTIIFRLQTT